MHRRPTAAASAGFLILAALVATSGCSTKTKEAAKPAATAKVEKLPGESDLIVVTLTPKAEERLKLKTAPVVARSMAVTRTVGGDVVVPPGKTLIVAAPIAGTLKAPAGGMIEPGRTVPKGQVIFTMVPFLNAEARMTFETTRADVVGQIEGFSKTLTQAKNLLDRAVQLKKDNLGGQAQVEDAQAAVNVAQAALDAAISRRDAIDKAISGTGGGAVKDVAIVAEGGGTLRNLHAAPGQMVAPGATLFEIVQLDPVNVRVPVYVGDVAKLAKGAPAVVAELSSDPDALRVSARPIDAPPSGDPLASTVDLFYSVPNPGGRLKPGQRVGVTLTFNNSKGTLVVPLAAVVRDVDGGSWVYEALGDHKFARRRVRIQAVADGLASLSAGPAKDVQVVTDGAFELFGVEFGGAK